MSESENGIILRECKLKWTTLRNCYARLLREERSHKVKKRHWHLRNEMNFLRGHIQPYAETRGISSKRAPSARSKPLTDSTTTNYSFDENTLQSKEQSNESSTSNIIQNPPIQDFVIVEPTEQLNNDWEHQEHSTQENETINCCPVIDFNPFSLPERITDTAEDISPPKNKDEQSEANILFLRSLLPDINKLSDRKQRIFKRKTLEVLELLFDEGDFEIQRDDNHIRQCQITRSNYNVQQHQHATIVAEKFVQKMEPTSP